VFALKAEAGTPGSVSVALITSIVTVPAAALLEGVALDPEANALEPFAEAYAEELPEAYAEVDAVVEAAAEEAAAEEAAAEAAADEDPEL
jgi:hypothetical protein